MSPKTSQWRKTMIKLAAMKIDYRRAFDNKNLSLNRLASLHHEIEILEIKCRLLFRKLRH